MKKIISALIAVAASSMTIQVSFAAELDFVASKRPLTNDGRAVEVKVVSKNDQIAVKEIVINRGSCQVNFTPTKVKFGESFFAYTNYCNPMEVEVKTDKGSSRISWDR